MADEPRHEDELRARLAQVKQEIIAIDDEFQGKYIEPTSEVGQRYNDLNAEHDVLSKTIKQNDQRKARLAEIAEQSENTSDGAPSFNTRAPGAVSDRELYDLSSIRSSVAKPEDMRTELHERANRAVDRMSFPHDRADRAKCQEAVTRLLGTDDEYGSLAKRVLGTSSPSYKQAFGKWIANFGNVTPQYQAALQIGTDTSGGFAVPVELDPTIIPTYDMQVNPYRQIGRVVQTTAKIWEGVQSAGVTAHRRLELGVSADDSPSFAQPTVKPTRVDVFIPFSIELQASWTGMQGDLARMIQDAKDNEEATAFTTGNGTDPNPEGLITGATVTVTTAGTATFASVDLDNTEDALGASFRSRAQWLGSRSIYNLIRHFANNNGPDLWVRIAAGLDSGGNTGQTLLGYRANEVSSMATVTTTGSKFLVLGDFNYFLIVDKVGLNMELVQHVFDPTTARPMGQRGFFAYWMNSCKVINPRAFRTLVAR